MDSVATPVPAAPADLIHRLEPIVQQRFPSAVAALSALARIPSVAWEGFDVAEVRRSAEAVAALATETGLFDEVRIAQAPTPTGALGQPAVLATRAAKPGWPTVLMYAHHDVQPPGDDALWESPPFEPTVRGDRLYGRGTADDKAGVITHLTAIGAVAELLGDDFGAGLALFIEGEEEYGSRSFAAFLEQHRTELDADAIIVADSGNWDIETPGLTVSLRGNVTFQLTVRTLEHASHSGMLGGVVPDAMLAAIRILNSFWDEEGAVAVAGMRSHEAETPAYTEEQLRAESGLLPGVSPIGRGTLLARTWFEPAITVTGIDAPSVKNASNTIQPQVTVKVSARVAPGQRAQEAYEALRAHIDEHAPFGARVEISDVDLGDPFLVDTDGWAVEAMTSALDAAFGRETVQIGVGGSIPFIADLVRVFPGAQILVTGVEDPDSRAHSPNESLHLGVLRRAILAEAAFLASLGSAPSSTA